MPAATARRTADQIRQEATAEKPAEPLARTAKGTFAKGNLGRRSGTRTKATSEARVWALPLVPEVLAWRRKHRTGCDAAKDCAMCRHYNDMVLHYAYGKPPQRQELIMASMKEDIGQLAKAMGLSEDQARAAVKDVEQQLAALKSA